jgi:hypothetical protein
MSIISDPQSVPLPKHTRMTGDPCTGTACSDVVEDVGLTCGTCPVCLQEFVWVYRTNTWMLLKEFENHLAEANARGAFAGV